MTKSLKRQKQVEEQSHGLAQLDSAFFNYLLQEMRSLGPKWTDPFFAPFAPQHDTGGRCQPQIGPPQASDLADAFTGVEHQAQHCSDPLLAVGSIDGSLSTEEAFRLSFRLSRLYNWLLAKPSGLSLHPPR
jgi:hypothetical protein